MRKRWRYETSAGGTGALALATFGPWKTPVEIHQISCTFTTSAAVANRFIAVRHEMIAPQIILGEFASQVQTASLSRIQTFGQALYAFAQTVFGTQQVGTANLPFSFQLDINERLSVFAYSADVADVMNGITVMLRDLIDEPTRGR